jgi:HPt (histidine-containing phosphotransfer) domain-containing protein
VRLSAHNLKGAAASLGARALAAACGALEAQGRAGLVAGVEAALPAVQRLLRDTCAALDGAVGADADGR